MGIFFLIIEIFTVILTFYILTVKKELSVFYIPVIVFCRLIIEPITPAMTYYGIVSLLIIYLIYKNSNFARENVFSILLVALYLVLLSQVSNFETIRASFFSVIWFFLSIPLISSIYRKYDKAVVFAELSMSAFIILAIFIINVAFSSFYGYSPKLMYGITSGVLYGNLYATDFNIIAIAIFIVLLNAVSKKNLIYLVTSIIAFSFIMLSFRRSVMGLAALGVVAVLFIVLSQNSFKKTLLFAALIIGIGVIVAMNTSFMDVFIARYEQRNLAERALSEETRFMEYDIVYKDMFVYKDYSPWFGYELLNSSGNYGKGILGDRTLHSDIPNIIHSTGIVGMVFYLLMMGLCFLQAFKFAQSKMDYGIVLFCGAAFVVYTITGRYTSAESMMLLVLLLMMPLSAFYEPESKERDAVTASGSFGQLDLRKFKPGETDKTLA